MVEVLHKHDGNLDISLSFLFLSWEQRHVKRKALTSKVYSEFLGSGPTWENNLYDVYSHMSFYSWPADLLSIYVNCEGCQEWRLLCGRLYNFIEIVLNMYSIFSKMQYITVMEIIWASKKDCKIYTARIIVGMSMKWTFFPILPACWYIEEKVLLRWFAQKKRKNSQKWPDAEGGGPFWAFCTQNLVYIG